MTHSAIGSVLTTAGIATAVTSAAVTLASQLQTGHPAAGLNATSHIVWGDRAAKRNDFDWAHTALGAALNASAMVAWATVQHSAFPRVKSVLGACAVGATVSALAYATDFHVVPKRLTPGFEKRFSQPVLLTVYGVLACALAFAAWRARRRDA